MVPNIKDVCPEHELMTFFDREPLLNREVPVLLVRSAERIAWRSTETGSASRSTGNEVSSPEANRIQIVVQLLLNCAGRVVAVSGTQVTERRSAAARLSEGATARAVSY